MRARPLLQATAALAVGLVPAGCGPSSPLAGKVVVLDAGHNGGNAAAPAVVNRLVWIGTGWKACDTTGTATNGGYPEHAFTFDVVSRAARELTALGARVVLTRTGDTGVGPCVTDRAQVGNAVHANVAVSVHGDGAVACGHGVDVIRPAPLPGLTAGIYWPSRHLADVLRATFVADTRIPNANYLDGGSGIDERADLGGLNMSRVPKVFIETGNMRNAGDAATMSSASGRASIAHGIADGIRRYLTGR